jgi:hypothetical protein
MICGVRTLLSVEATLRIATLLIGSSFFGVGNKSFWLFAAGAGDLKDVSRGLFSFKASTLSDNFARFAAGSDRSLVLLGRLFDVEALAETVERGNSASSEDSPFDGFGPR